ncbi:MAG: polysaccharide biosynthesis protein [Rubrobacteraceae bacterium]
MQSAFQHSPPALRRWAAMLVDAVIVLESFVVALLFRFNGDVPPEFLLTFWPFAILSAFIFVALLYESGVYQSILRYTGIYQGVRVASATAIATGGLFIADFASGKLLAAVTGRVLGHNPVPLGVVLIGAVLAYLQLVAVRLYPRVFYELSLREIGRRTRAVIIGVEEPGVALAGHIWRTPAMNTQVVGFVSESPVDVGKQIEDAQVVGSLDDIDEVIVRHGVDQMIIATSHTDRDRVDGIWRSCIEAGVEVKVMPELGEVLSQGAFKLRELQIEDLLGREPVDIDLEALSGYINGKRVLVTGASGSIGSELSRQISRLGPSKLVLLDRDESGLYYLSEELGRGESRDPEVFVGDVTLPERVRGVFERFKPQIVFHAAAYKHVPMMELQATEAIVNNVHGTLNVARAAGEYGAEKFINVSTDKAVNPANVMGATKRLSEMIVRAVSEEYPETVLASVRFGNVLGSRGSVVPTFRRQIEAGGPVTVTHPEMTRYFMIIPEAVSLILQAGAMADSYATYLLEMGRPIKIIDLARNMVDIMGARDVKIKFTGLRPGEKIREELSAVDERRSPTDHQMVFRLVSEVDPEADPVSLSEEMILHARSQDTEKAIKLLQRLVPNYSTADLPPFTSENELHYPSDWK